MQFLKILSAVLVTCLLIIPLVCIAAVLETWFATAGPASSVSAIELSLFIAAFGFVIFGIPGSLFWAVIYGFTDTRCLSATKRHLLAAGIAALLWPPLLIFMSEGLHKSAWYTASRFTLIVIPVALLSVYIYRLLYLRRRKIISAHGPH